MTDSPILKAALRWLALIRGCDRVPPAASAPVGKAPTSLIYHVRWYRAAATFSPVPACPSSDVVRSTVVQ